MPVQPAYAIQNIDRTLAVSVFLLNPRNRSAPLTFSAPLIPALTSPPLPTGNSPLNCKDPKGQRHVKQLLYNMIQGSNRIAKPAPTYRSVHSKQM
jgi:hypothetical protein